MKGNVTNIEPGKSRETQEPIDDMRKKVCWSCCVGECAATRSALAHSSVSYEVLTWSLHNAKDWNIEDRSGFDMVEELGTGEHVNHPWGLLKHSPTLIIQQDIIQTCVLRQMVGSLQLHGLKNMLGAIENIWS